MWVWLLAVAWLLDFGARLVRQLRLIRQEYPPKSIYTLVCCFKRYYEQYGVFDVNPLSLSDSRFGNFRVTLDAEMKREKENDPDSDSVICLALYIPHQLFSPENSCCCICAGQTNVLSHDLYLVHFATFTTLSHATCSWKSVHYLVIAHIIWLLHT